MLTPAAAARVRCRSQSSFIFRSRSLAGFVVECAPEQGQDGSLTPLIFPVLRILQKLWGGPPWSARGPPWAKPPLEQMPEPKGYLPWAKPPLEANARAK